MILNSVHDIKDKYDNFIVDIWGVVHNGHELFPYVKDTLQELKSLGKEVIFLTNAPRRSKDVIKDLETFGLQRSDFHDLHSSGEDAFEHLAPQGNQHYQGLSNKCFAFISNPGHTMLLEDCHLERVGDIEEASFILNLHPPQNENMTNKDYEILLKKAILAKTPMICVNPDMGVVLGKKVFQCAGALAQFYEELGGTVHYHGKPFSPIYESVLSKFSKADKSRTIAIGDSLRTDITGAHNFGIDSVLVLSGLDAHHANENTGCGLEALAGQFLNGTTIQPTYVCSELK